MVAVEPARHDAVEFGVRVAERMEQPQAKDEDRDSRQNREQIGAGSRVSFWGRQHGRHALGIFTPFSTCQAPVARL
jgi:hypothetical protein